MLSIAFVLSTLPFVYSGLHPAKRQMETLTPQDVCGSSAVDCGGGYCCLAGTECVANDPPLCKDNLLPDLTLPALDYSSFLDLLDFSDLTSLGLTLSTFPITLTAGQTLPSYSDNVVSTPAPRVTSGTGGPTPTSEGAVATASSTAGAEVRGFDVALLVGGIVGVGVWGM